MNIKYRYIHFFMLFAGLFLAILNVHSQKNKNSKNNQNQNTHKVLNSQDVKLSELYSDATTQKMIENYKEALNLYLMCIKISPNHAPSNYEAASIFAMSKQYESALPYIQTAVKYEPENKWYLILQSQILLELKKYKEAIKVFQELSKKEPENYDHILDLADVFILQGDYKSAIGEYNKLESIVGVTAEVSIQKQKLYEAMGKFKQAVEEMQKLIEAYPTVAEYYGMFAELYLAHGKKEEAKKLYEKVVELDPSNPVIHLALANYYQESGNAEQSFTYLKMAFKNPEVGIDDKVKILLSYYEISQTNASRRLEAFELIDILTLTHPDEPKAWSIKGDFLLRETKFSEAIVCFEKVLEYDNSKYPVWEQLLALYVQDRNFHKLTLQSTQAIEVFPTQPLLYYYNGYGNYQLKQFDKALENYLAGKDLVIDNRELLLQFHSSIGDCYYKLGKYKESDEAYEYVLQKDPQNISTLNNYAYNLSLRGEKLDKAIEMAERLLKLDSNNPAYLDTYAWILYKKGDFKEAKKYILNAIEAGGNFSGEIIEHYGDILYMNGEKEKALENWIKAKEIGGALSDNIDQKIKDKKLAD